MFEIRLMTGEERQWYIDRYNKEVEKRNKEQKKQQKGR
jgi:hypothetical protein